MRDLIRQTGEVLGRQAEAEDLVSAYDAGLDALKTDDTDGPRAAIYAMRGWTQGERTLSGQILKAAGYRNIATEMGMMSGGILPLELLALADPDVVITSQPYPGYSRAQEFLDHPVVDYLRARSGQALLSDRDWVCGTPYVLRAVEALAKARFSHQQGGQ